MSNRFTRFTQSTITALFLCIFMLAAPAAAKNTVASVLGSKDLNGATVGFVAWDMDTGETLYEQNIDQLMTPASNMKIVTAATAMLGLGTEFQFVTAFHAGDWNPGAGTARNLFVIGNGDPTFSGEFFDSNAAAADALAGLLKNKGLKRIDGDMILDARAFSGADYPEGWSKEDPWYCYGMKVGALSIAENCLIVTVQGASKAGNAPTVKTDPPLHSSFVVNNVKTVSKGNSSIKVSQNSKGVVTITGQVRAGKSASHEYPAPYPDMLFGSALAAALQRAGIGFQGSLSRASEFQGSAGQWTQIASVGSPQMMHILGVMLKHSDNFIAEMMTRTMGAQTGPGGTTIGGAQAISQILYESGIASSGTIRIFDGSGLSRNNRLTPRVLMQLFRTFYNSYMGPGLMAALAEPGQPGTLKKRLTGTAAVGNIKAKTGALRGVCSLSGYFTRKNGHTGAFVMFMNGYSVHSNNIRAIQDKLALVMLEM
jgi:PBP4 family serine-type D-alanyl-D-alanine carboxypeptidase